MTIPRAHDLGARPEPVKRAVEWPIRTGPVVIVGVALLVGNSYCGLRRLVRAWPLACYPTFDGPASRERATLKVAVVDALGHPHVLDDHSIVKRGTLGRWEWLLYRILHTEDEATRRKRLEALWQLWVREDPQWQHVQAVRFYKVTRSVIPEPSPDTTAREEFLWELKLQA